MVNNIKLSVIVPVYNAANYLRRCVESIENQDLPKDCYEVILVNDGSADNSLDIARKMSELYSNVIVIDKENGGTSSARNAGMDVARGTYMIFIDSDDYVYPNKMKGMISLCENNNLDLLYFTMEVERENGSVINDKCGSVDYDKIYNLQENLWLLPYVIGSICCLVVRSSLLNNHSLRFHLGIIHEDTELTTRICAFAQRLMFSDVDFYHYTYNSVSQTRDVSNKKKFKILCDGITMMSLSRSFVKNESVSPTYKEAILRMTNNGMIGTLVNLLFINPMFTLEQVKDYLNKAHQAGIYPVKKPFGNKRSLFASYFLNCQRLFLFVYNLRHKEVHGRRYVQMLKNRSKANAS